MLGNAYSYLPGGNAKSLEYYLKAADVCKVSKDSTALYRTYVNLGYLYNELGAPEKAAAYVLEANKYHEEKGILLGLAHSQSSLGRIYNLMEDYDEALKYEFAALKSFKSLGHNQGVITSYINIGNNLAMKKEHEQKILYMDSALALNGNTLKSKYFREICMTNIATSLFALNRLAECDAITDSLLTIMQNRKNSSRYGRLLSTKAEVSIALNRTDTAKYYLDKALEIAENYNDLQGRYIAYRFYKTLYEKLGNYKLALDYYAKAVEIDKNLRSAEKDRDVKNLAIVYETEKKNQTIAFQEKEIENKNLILHNERVKNWFLLITLILILIIFVAVFVYQRQIHKRKAEAEQSRKEKEIARYKLQVVNNQISPHFTFNAVNSLKGLIAGEKKEAALEAFSKFSKLINATLTASDSFTNTIEQEMKFIDLFLDFRKFRYEDKFEYKITVADDVDLNFVILRLSVQELVENAIKHGIRHKTTSDGMVNVDVKKDDNYYVFTVSDNGIGREKAQKLRTTGTGKGAYIQNMMNNILNTNNEAASDISYTDLFDSAGKPAGTRATLLIPINYKYEL
jgi:tetratricopeptide (TPR) repeat protein